VALDSRNRSNGLRDRRIGPRKTVETVLLFDVPLNPNLKVGENERLCFTPYDLGKGQRKLFSCRAERSVAAIG